MPNWCENRMTISHTDPKKIDEVIEAAKNGNLFNYFVPMPEELVNTRAQYIEESKMTEYQKSLIEKYGAKDWYDWSRINWGTKWDADNPRISTIYSHNDKTCVDIDYETPWTTADEALIAAVKKGFVVENFYIEEGVGFCGYWQGALNEYDDPVYDDTCIEYSHENIGTEEEIDEFIENRVPKIIDEKFSLRERFLNAIDL